MVYFTRQEKYMHIYRHTTQNYVGLTNYLFNNAPSTAILWVTAQNELEFVDSQVIYA